MATLQNFPSALQPIIQTGYLERRFETGLRSKLAYRQVADRETFRTGVGETITKTRPGLLASATTPISPTSAAAFPTGSVTNLDNGLTPTNWTVEQYTLALAEYANTMNLNTMGETVGVVNQFSHNAYALGENAARTLDQLARNALFGAYASGQTRVRTTLGSPGTSLAVDDIRGFQYAINATNNAVVAVSGSNTLAVTINGTAYTVTGAAVDGTNVSSLAAFGGISGVLTLSGNVSTTDGTLGNAVVSGIAPSVIRPSARASTYALQATDVLTMANILDAKTKLENNAVPRIDGFYHMYLDPTSARELFADADFKQLFQGATAENVAFRAGELADPFLGVRFIPTTEALLSAHPTLAGVTVHRPIIVGQGALIEGTFAGKDHHDTGTSAAVISNVDGVSMITREPLDRLQQNIAQSWYWVGGYCAPTDVTVNSNIIATASNAMYKRAVMLEHV